MPCVRAFDFLARPALQKLFLGLIPARHHSSLRVVRRTPPGRFAVRPVALALHEHLIDMVFGDESDNRFADRSGIGTDSTMLLPASVMPSPSAGSAVTR